MVKYILKRIGQSIISIFLIVSVVFLLLRLMPTDYYFTEDELIKLTDEQKESKLRAAGLLDPPLVQLGRYYKNMFTFSAGYNFSQDDLAKTEAYAGTLSDDKKTVATLKTLYKRMVEAPDEYYGKLSDKNRKLVDTYVAEHPDDVLTVKLLDAYDNQTMTTDLKKSVAAAVGVRGFHINVKFDLGESRRVDRGKPVMDIIGEKMIVSMKLSLVALAISIFVGVIIGVFQAKFKDGIFDHIGTGYTVIVNAVPALVLYSLILVFGAKLFHFPARFDINNFWGSSVLPIVCLSIGSIASYMLWIRRYMVDELNKDYIRLAKLKGMSSNQVMFKHVLRNAFVPMVQQLPVSILLTVGGSLLVETFYAVPGMGPMLTTSINRFDCNMVQAIVLLYAVMGIVGLLIGDILMTIVDPRISLKSKGGTR